MGLKIGKFYQFIQSYGPSFMTKFCSALLYLENLLTSIFAKLNLRGGVSCMPAALLCLLLSHENNISLSLSLSLSLPLGVCASYHILYLSLE